jgi:anaerobic magnesium-protoporphyrin IX monomethyl ester cyclase
MSDILLFNPPAPGSRSYTREGRCTQEAGVWGTQWPPLTFATASALLKQDGHRVTLRDYAATGADLRSLMEDLRTLQPGFAIWSTGTPTLSSDLGMARIVRENSPESVTAVIGTHVTVRPSDALHEAALDAVVRGEPEGIIRDLCRYARAWTDVAGISWRDREGTIRHNPDASLLEPEAIPAPDWDGLDRDVYRLPLKGRRFLIAAPVRGCPYRCTFCTAPLYYGHRLRRRPVARVVDEMAAAVSRYGIREFFIWADTFTADRRYVQDLCRCILEQGLRISWACNSRVDTVDEQTLRLMKQAGLWMISFGLESGNDEILAASEKGITTAQSCEAVRMADGLGIRTAGHFMFGLPGETEETMAQTLALALSLPLDIAQFYAAAPFPGTALYEEAVREGWLNLPGPSTRECAQNRAVMELPDLPAERVDAFRRKAYRRFYLRPRAMIRVLSMAEPGALAGMAPLLRRCIGWMH